MKAESVGLVVNAERAGLLVKRGGMLVKAESGSSGERRVVEK